MIYAAFAVWLFLILLIGSGVYRLWGRLARGAWVNWALLPGTVVSEMGYIFGSLITGGEIRRARLMPEGGRQSRSAAHGEPTAEAAPRLKVIGPIIAAMIAIIACAAAIILIHSLLGEPVIDQFITADGLLRAGRLPGELPGSWAGLWDQLEGQLALLRRISETWAEVDWRNWRTGLFVYLSICLSVRLGSVGRNFRATLAAVVVIAAMIALVGLIWTKFSDLMDDIWPLLTYIYTLLLFLLFVTLLVRGIILLAGVLMGRKTA